MKATLGEFLDIFIGVQQLDSQLEKIAPATRFKIGILLNKLKPLGVAYDQAHAQAAKNASTPIDGKPVDQVTAHSNLMTEIAKLRAVESEINVPTLLKSELRMDENPKISGVALSMVLSVLRGFEDPEPE